MDELETASDKNIDKISDILSNELAYISTDILDFGYKYREALNTYPVSTDKLCGIKNISQQFVVVLCRVIVNRIPSNMKLFQAASNFSIDRCLRKINRPKFHCLPFDLNEHDLAMVENQWNNLINVGFETTEQFWVMVSNFKNAGGDYFFKELSQIALNTLSLPISNAFVERVFSTMNIVKNKIRNKINVTLLDAIIRIRFFFYKKGICCKDFKVTKLMYEKFRPRR